MSLEVVISDASGTRVLGEQDLPLNIGTAPDSSIRIPGPVASGFLAQLGALDGRAFVQVPGQGRVTVNDDTVTSTRWLETGDELRVAGARIQCTFSEGRAEFAVDLSEVDYECWGQ